MTLLKHRIGDGRGHVFSAVFVRALCLYHGGECIEACSLQQVIVADAVADHAPATTWSQYRYLSVRRFARTSSHARQFLPQRSPKLLKLLTSRDQVAIDGDATSFPSCLVSAHVSFLWSTDPRLGLVAGTGSLVVIAQQILGTLTVLSCATSGCL
jgi:hypothetical protein